MLVVALVLLGLGWNLRLVSGTTLVTDAMPVGHGGPDSGTDDLGIALAGAGAGLSSGLIITAQLCHAHSPQRCSRVDHPDCRSRPGRSTSQREGFQDQARHGRSAGRRGRSAGAHAMRMVPRVAFVPPDQVELADHDADTDPHWPGDHPTSLSATMIQALRLAGTEHVLEVGTGYGFTKPRYSPSWPRS